MVRQSLFTRWFAIVFTASLATELSNSLLVHFPGFLLGFGANEARIGTIVALAGVASIGARPWMGRIMDRHSRRLVIRWGTVLTALATLAYAFVDEIGPLVIGARLLQGLGQAMTATAFWTYISDRFPAEKRAQGVALFGISGLIPLALGPGLGDLLLGTAGYDGLFFLASGLALVAFALTLFLEKTGVHHGATPIGFWAVLRLRHMAPVWVGTFALSLGFTAAFVFVKTYVTTSGLETVGPYFLAYGSTAILWRLGFSWVPDRVGPSRMITPALLLYALGMTILGVGGSQAVLALAGLATGLGHGIGYPVMLALSTLRTTKGDRGAATAIFTAIFDLALIGMPPVLGLTISLFGYRSMFWATAVTIVIGLIVVRRLDLRAGSTTSPAPSP